MRINKYDLVKTCEACPEEYDVFLDGKQVGYLRLRHDSFRADVPDCMGETIYTADPRGDGVFEDDERDFYLRRAVKAIDDYLKHGSIYVDMDELKEWAEEV